MVISRYVSIKKLKSGMVIAKSVQDARGRELVVYGSTLNDYQIEALKKLGIPGVYIREGEDEKEDIPLPIQDKIERLTVEDEAKVQLSESVKKRVAEGIQYLYQNVDSEHFAEAADGIANELLKSIEENNAIAVDIGMLKVSDEYTFRHSVDVATIAMVIAKKYGMNERQIRAIGIAGLLHDVGKSKIPNEILNKAGKLTDEEFAVMRQHPVLGYKILMDKQDISDEIAHGVLEHHEKVNGKGYPLGLKGAEISPYAKIISVADIYDALVTERPYKKPMTKRDAVEMIMALTDEIDITAMKSFLGSVILYPVGCTVQLSSGEPARVVSNNEGYILRPKVVGLKTGKIYDLAGDFKCANVVIQ